MEPFDAEVRLLLARERAAQLRNTMLATGKRARRNPALKQPAIAVARERVVLRPSR